MTKLKLIAMDESDLAVISAQVQDALTRPDAIDYSPRQRRFSIVLNRFAWDGESATAATRDHERRQSVLSFARVNAVQTKGVRRDDGSQVLSLMAVRFRRTDAPAGTVELIFAEGVEIRLSVECLEVLLDDTGAAWGTRFKPRHPLA